MLFEDTVAGHVIELIWRIYFFTRRSIDSRMKQLELTYPQFGTLVSLQKKERISQKKLAEALGTDTTNMMVVCDSLEKKELIQRISNPKDRRENLIVRTEAGVKMTVEALRLMEDYVFSITGSLEKKELSALLPVLKKMLAKLAGEKE